MYNYNINGIENNEIDDCINLYEEQEIRKN
jgi:hypothetical protein